MEKNLYNAVRERIQELVPELKELSFGCEIMVEGCEHTFTFISDEGDCYNLLTETGETRKIPKPGYTLILGHEPRLADVLRAIVRSKKSYQMSVHGKTEYENNEIMYFHHDKFDYDLTDDRLSAQSSETIRFIADIIGVRE